MAGTNHRFNQPFPPEPPMAPAPAAAPSGAGAATDRAERLARLAASRAGGSTAARPAGGTAAPRRAHPSKGARTVALVSSLLATGGLGVAMAAADGTQGAGAVATGTSTGSSLRATTSSTGRYADGTWTGASEWTRWGYVQVQATVKNGKLTDITALQTPNDRRSASINAQAQPVLEREAIAAQSAGIDMVSGATYTSRTYTASLQSALDQAAQATTTAKAGQS